MERVTSAAAGALDLLAPPYTIMDFDLPDARLNDFGRSAQLAGAGRYEAHYNDAPWSLQVKVEPVTDADITALTAAFTAGALLSWGAYRSRIVDVDVTADADHGTMRLITYGGTREPAWLGTTTPFSLSVTGGIGTAALPTVGGTLAAEMSLTTLCASSATILALGIRPAPAAGYDPFDGTGTLGTAVNLSTTPATLWAGSDVDVAANRGTHYGIAKLAHTSTTAGATRYRLTSTLLAATKRAASIASGVTNATESLYLGKVTVPAAQLPTRNGVVYGSETTLVNIATGTTRSFAVAQDSTTVLTQTLGSELAGFDGRLTLSFKLSLDTVGNNSSAVPSFGWDGAPATEVVNLTMPSGSTPQVITYTLDNVSIPVGATGIFAAVEVFSTAATNINHTRDTTAPYTNGVGGIDFVAGDGIDSTVDNYLVIKGRRIISFNAKTPITATCSQASKAAQFASLTRIPADNGAFVYTGAIAAGAGVTYDPASRSLFPADSGGATGTALSPIKSPCEFAPLPGENTLVLHTDGGTTTLVGTITERRITRG